MYSIEEIPLKSNVGQIPDFPNVAHYFLIEDFQDNK